MSATRCLFIGDDRQAIYGFTGAENDSMNIIKETFNAKELSLPVCYRCAKSIIEKAQEIVSDIQYREDAPVGTIREEKYDTFLNNASEYALTKNDGIICRNNAPLVALAFGLIRKGIGCRIEGKDIGRNLITLCNKWKVKDLNTFTNRLIDFTNKEMSKPMNRVKLQLLEDKLDTMIILIERCQSLGKHDVDSLKNLIDSMFSDSDDPKVPNVVVLSSIHKAKGLEWKRCFVLGNAQFIPSKYATQAWQQVQEENLKYISITRAMEELVYIIDVPTRRNNPEES
jgi:superfamily I DNA/RNA helicase